MRTPTAPARERHRADDGCELDALSGVLLRLGVHRVVVVVPPEEPRVLGELVRVLGPRIVAVYESVRDVPTPADVFALADVADSAGADGVVAAGTAAARRLVVALAPVLPLPSAVVTDDPDADTAVRLVGHGGRLTLVTDERARPDVVCRALGLVGSARGGGPG